MRGKVNYIIDSNYNMGITPAYAGKSIVCYHEAPF